MGQHLVSACRCEPCSENYYQVTPDPEWKSAVDDSIKADKHQKMAELLKKTPFLVDSPIGLAGEAALHLAIQNNAQTTALILLQSNADVFLFVCLCATSTKGKKKKLKTLDTTYTKKSPIYKHSEHVTRL